MKPYADNTVTFRLVLAGYRAAVVRFHAGRLTREVAAAYHPLFEALNWAVALDDQARAHWSPRGKPLNWAWRNEMVGGDYVRAVRFARNRVHHQWADALELTAGAVSPLTSPIVFHEWCWRGSADLPAGADSRDEAAYGSLLAYQPARHVLDRLGNTHAQLAELIEPPTVGDVGASKQKT